MSPSATLVKVRFGGGGKGKTKISRASIPSQRTETMRPLLEKTMLVSGVHDVRHERGKEKTLGRMEGEASGGRRARPSPLVRIAHLVTCTRASRFRDPASGKVVRCTRIESTRLTIGILMRGPGWKVVFPWLARRIALIPWMSGCCERRVGRVRSNGASRSVFFFFG